jgi:hypothetical protein
VRTERGARWGILVAAATAVLVAGCGDDQAPSADRQGAVASRGAEIMPFDLAATTHRFEPVDDGLIETVVADDHDDPEQDELVRQHLAHEASRFARGDYGDPATIHDDAMPGLADLEAGAGDIRVVYQPIDAVGRITYTSSTRALVDALHRWGETQPPTTAPTPSRIEPASRLAPAWPSVVPIPVPVIPVAHVLGHPADHLVAPLRSVSALAGAHGLDAHVAHGLRGWPQNMGPSSSGRSPCCRSSSGPFRCTSRLPAQRPVRRCRHRAIAGRLVGRRRFAESRRPVARRRRRHGPTRTRTRSRRPRRRRPAHAVGTGAGHRADPTWAWRRWWRSRLAFQAPGASEAVEPVAVLVVDLPARVAVGQDVFRPARPAPRVGTGPGRFRSRFTTTQMTTAQNASTASGMTNHQPPQASFDHIEFNVPVSSTHCSESEQAFLDRVGQISQRDSRLQRQAREVRGLLRLGNGDNRYLLRHGGPLPGWCSWWSTRRPASGKVSGGAPPPHFNKPGDNLLVAGLSRFHSGAATRRPGRGSPCRRPGGRRCGRPGRALAGTLASPRAAKPRAA